MYSLYIVPWGAISLCSSWLSRSSTEINSEFIGSLYIEFWDLIWSNTSVYTLQWKACYLKTSAITKKLRQSVPKFVYATEGSSWKTRSPWPYPVGQIGFCYTGALNRPVHLICILSWTLWLKLCEYWKICFWRCHCSKKQDCEALTSVILWRAIQSIT